MQPETDISSAELTQMIVSGARVSRCVLCGKCAAVCPSYNGVREEIYSPRGRVALIGAFLEGTLKPAEKFSSSLSTCLMCGACDESCPTGVRPTLAVLLVKNYTEFENLHSDTKKYLAGVSGEKFPLSLLKKSNLLPPGHNPPLTSRLYELPPPPEHPIRHTAFFLGCVMNQLLPQAAEASIRLLRRLGYDAQIPEGLQCCGMPYALIGELGMARSVALGNIEALEKMNPDVIVTDCATCSAALKSYPDWFCADSDEAHKAAEIAGKVRIFSEFLEEFVPLSDTFDSFDGLRVVYDDACVLRHWQGVYSAPRHLLNSLKGLMQKEVPGEDCSPGWAGILLTRAVDIADKISRRRLDSLKRAGVDAVITEDAARHLMLLRSLRDCKSPIRALHISELLLRKFKPQGARGRKKIPVSPRLPSG